MELRDHKAQYPRETVPKIRGTKIRQNGGFSELVILVVKENGALSERSMDIMHMSIVPSGGHRRQEEDS